MLLAFLALTSLPFASAQEEVVAEPETDEAATTNEASKLCGGC